MPQMAPINWTLMFLIFLSLYVMTAVIIFFIQETPSVKPLLKTTNNINKKMNWKW